MIREAVSFLSSKLLIINHLWACFYPKFGLTKNIYISVQFSNGFKKMTENNIKTKGVSYVTDCIAPAQVEPSA